MNPLFYLKLMGLFPLQPIQTNKHHKQALKIIEILIDYINSSEIKDDGITLYLKTCSKFVEDFERERFPRPKVSANELLGYLLELKGLKQVDLAEELGGQSVVSDILNGKRELNIKQIRALAKKFKVPASVFI